MEQDTTRSVYDDDRAHSDARNQQSPRPLPPPGVMPGQTVPHLARHGPSQYPTPVHGPSPAQQAYPQPQYNLPPRRRRRLSGPNCLLYALTIFVGGGILITVITVVVVAIIWSSFNRTLTERLDQIVPQQANTFQTTRIYDRTGNELSAGL